MFGQYMVYDQLGIGGMASVHIAESRSAGGFRKRVALKRLLAHAAADPSLVEAFAQEARIDARLRHPNITRTYDFGEVDGTYFIAMELVAGPTVSQLLRQCHATIGMVALPVALHVLLGVCDALHYAHTLTDESGTPLEIVHRDVSPPNIIISSTGVVKLIDFGVARASTSAVKTQTGIIKGKVGYLPPEYLRSGKLDVRADLWSLGVVAHELLTCNRLFEGEHDLQVLEQIRAREIKPPSSINSSVPRGLDAVVMTALEREPERRWQSAAAMRNALRTEVAELGAQITNKQVMAWVEWAFSQTQAEERSGVSELIKLLDQPSKANITIDPDPETAVGLPAYTIKRRDKQPELPTAPSPWRGWWKWPLALLLVAALAAAAVWALDHYNVVHVWKKLKALR
jgi:serine/threonine protein kinase